MLSICKAAKQPELDLIGVLAPFLSLSWRWKKATTIHSQKHIKPLEKNCVKNLLRLRSQNHLVQNVSSQLRTRWYDNVAEDSQTLFIVISWLRVRKPTVHRDSVQRIERFLVEAVQWQQRQVLPVYHSWATQRLK